MVNTSSDYYKNNWRTRVKELSDKKVLDDHSKESLSEMIDSPDQENMVLAEELLKLRISEAVVAGLNQGQLDAFLKIVEELRHPQHDAIVLKGYAGTGKTYLISRVIEYLRAVYPFRKIGITAPTNKAVHVLCKSAKHQTEMFEEYGQSKQSTVYCTVHKLLGLKEHINHLGVRSFVTEDKKAKASKYQYVIVDEVSMLSDEIFELLMEAQIEHDIKLIFMGDPAQVPPINKEHCAPFLGNHEYEMLQLELTEIMRQKGTHPIVDTSFQIRDNLTKHQPISFIQTDLNVKGQGIVHIDSKTQRHKVREVIRKHFVSEAYEKSSDHVKIIAWRNKTVAFLNDIVRTELLGTGVSKYTVGDRLVANKALFEPHKDNPVIKANTSDEFTVTKVQTGLRHLSVTAKGTRKKYTFEGKFWRIYTKPSQPIKSEVGDGEQLILYVVHDDSLEEYQRVIDKALKDAKAFKNAALWKAYYAILKWNDDIVYNYAITTHKAQGSTYDNVILIEEDLDVSRKTVERNRIKYTAYTRATERVYTLRFNS